MRLTIVVLAVATLAGCGVDTMSAGATAAALKKQEIEQGKKTMEHVQQQIGQAMTHAERRAEEATEAAGK